VSAIVVVVSDGGGGQWLRSTAQGISMDKVRRKMMKYSRLDNIQSPAFICRRCSFPRTTSSYW
jgi:hypothetical protein